jgi:hypothetical protein
MSIPFTYAVIDDDGEILRQYRWTPKEAKWHKDQGKNVIKLEVVKEMKQDAFTEAFSLVGECIV